MRFFGLCLAVMSGFSAPIALASRFSATLTGHLQIPNPAFLTILDQHPNGHPELLVSSFSMFGGTRVSRVNLSPTGDDPISSDDVTVINQSLIWPNEASALPDSILGPDYVAISTGFLVPGRTTGSVSLVHMKSGESIDVTKPKKGWFYHRTQFTDVNQDGLLDIVTARGTKPIIGASQGELLWLEQPRENKEKPWEEHIIASGPDVYFEMIDLDHDGSQEIIAAEFFSKKLSVHWRENDATWKSRVIDDTIGAVFDLEAADLNSDGRLDLVVTNHEGKNKGAIYAYEIPRTFKTAAWSRRTLLSGITTELHGINQASPGAPIVMSTSHGKPHILVAGDGSTKVHWLVPKSDSSDDWNYEEKILIDTNSTIGSMALSAPHADGSRELFVPAYDKNEIYIFKMVEH